MAGACANPGSGTETHDEVIRLILTKARNGTEVTYIPGNHDEMFRAWLPMGLEVGGVKLRREATHSDRRWPQLADPARRRVRQRRALRQVPGPPG